MRGCDLATVVKTNWYELLSVVRTVVGVADSIVGWLLSKFPLAVVIVSGVPCLNRSLAMDVAGFVDDTMILLIFVAVGCMSSFDGTAGMVIGVIGTKVIGWDPADFLIIFVIPVQIRWKISWLGICNKSNNVEEYYAGKTLFSTHQSLQRKKKHTTLEENITMMYFNQSADWHERFDQNIPWTINEINNGRVIFI